MFNQDERMDAVCLLPPRRSRKASLNVITSTPEGATKAAN